MPPRRRVLQALLGVTVLQAAVGLPGAAWALEPPKGKVVLTISGKLGVTNRDGKALLDIAMLEALPQKTFTTMTPWEKAPVKFTGPLLADDGQTMIGSLLNLDWGLGGRAQGQADAKTGAKFQNAVTGTDGAGKTCDFRAFVFLAVYLE